MALLTETADYDTPGSWGPASDGWPGIRGDYAYDMFVFANCVESIPYGSYVLMSREGEYKACVSYLRVHANYIEQFKQDFKDAGCPTAKESVERRERDGVKNQFGNSQAVPKWW